MQKNAMKNKMGNNTSKYVAAVGTDSNTKFKWLDDLVDDLLETLSNLNSDGTPQLRFQRRQTPPIRENRERNCEN